MEGIATHSSILTRKIPWTERHGGISPLGCKELDTTEATEHGRSQVSTEITLRNTVIKGKLSVP